MTPFGTASRLGAAGAVLAVAIALAGCVSTVSGTAVRGQTGPVDVPELTADKLDDVLLSIGEINGIMGATTMKVTSELEEMTDHSDDVSDPDCLGVMYGAEEPVYAGSGWTDVRDQVAREPGDDNDHWVEQTAVLYSSADDAQRFFDKSKAAWEKCSDSTVAVGSSGDSYFWEVGEVRTDGTLMTQVTTQEDADGWACQHALSTASNLTVEAWACSYAIGDEAATIAMDMLANAAK
ncbi:sensor domain-containing protein [Mycolicibacterium celeriflavum]|uniref:sensor domain-containing protein n=1 Tax=Mycolicibacterium celeriflavum TaxID=1249101 RepID=UPI003CF23629